MEPEVHLEWCCYINGNKDPTYDQLSSLIFKRYEAVIRIGGNYNLTDLLYVKTILNKVVLLTTGETKKYFLALFMPILGNKDKRPLMALFITPIIFYSIVQ